MVEILSEVWVTQLFGWLGCFFSCGPWDQSHGTTGDEQHLDHWENLDVLPVLAQHVTEVVFRLNPVKINDIGSYGFPDPVECQNVVPLAQG